MPMISAPSATARASSLGVVRLDERVEPELARRRRASAAPARRRGRAGGAAPRRRLRARLAARSPWSSKKPLASSGSAVAARAARRSSKRAAEALVDEHRDGRRAGALERRARARPGRHRAAGRPPTASGASPRRSRARPGLRERVAEAAHQAATGSSLRERDERLEPLAGGCPSRPPRVRERVARRRGRPRARRRRSRRPRSGGRASRFGPVAPAKISRIAAAFSSGEPPASSAGAQRGTPRSSGSISRRVTSPSTTSQTRFGPAGESSSIPPAPWTTNARRAPSVREHLGDRRHELGRVDADDLRPRAGRVRQRPEHVEDRARRQLAPHRRRMAHRGVVRRGEEEAEPELVDRALDPARRQVEPEAERLEHVGRARRRRDRAVAVLRDARAGGRRDERRRRRDVERACPVAARARRVDEVVALRPHREDVLAHRLGAARRSRPRVSPLSRSATRKPPICAGVASPLMISSITVARLGPRQVAAVEQPRERLLDLIAALQEVAAERGPDGRQHRLRVELDAVDRLARGGGRPSPRRRRPSRRPRARPGRGSRRASGSGRPRAGRGGRRRSRGRRGETALALPWTSLLRLPDLAAEGLDDRLVAEADAEGRNTRPEPAHDLDRARRRPRAGRGRGR